MIITKQFANRMDKKTLADLASDYATEFAHLLGYEGEVRITPEEVIYSQKEARKFFLERFKPKNFSKSIRKFAKFRYEDIRNKIDGGAAFVQGGVAFIPLTDLSRDEKGLVERLQRAQQKKSGWPARVLSTLLGRNVDYVSLNGFGSEVAHLTGYKLYLDRAQGGLGEALDMGSQLLERSKDIILLSKQSDKPEDSEKSIDEYLKQSISESRDEIVLYETMLFEGETATKQKIQELGICNVRRNIDYVLNLLKKQYVMSSHYDGIKLFLEIFDSVGGNLGETYRELGSILTNLHVTNIETALMELGYTSERLSRYNGVFGKDITERAKCLHLVKKIPKEIHTV